MSIGAAELARITRNVNFLHLSVYGAVLYNTVFDPVRRITSFWIEVRRNDEPRPVTIAKNRAADAIFPDEGDIPVADLRFIRSP